MRRKLSKELEVQPEVILAGTSLTYSLNINYFHSKRVFNLGIPGELTDGLIKRIPDIIKIKPKKVFIEIGINDILAGNDVLKVYSNIRIIVDELRRELPDVVIYIQGLFPTYLENGWFTQNNTINSRIIQLNRYLKHLCSQKRLNYINTHSLFMKQGQPVPEYFSDGVHLTDSAYIKWEQMLQPYIMEEL